MQETFEVGLLEPYVRELRTAIERIAGSGRDCDELRLSYRRYAIGSRLTFYRATVDGVDVIRSLHQRIDPTRHL